MGNFISTMLNEAPELSHLRLPERHAAGGIARSSKCDEPGSGVCETPAALTGHALRSGGTAAAVRRQPAGKLKAAASAAGIVIASEGAARARGSAARRRRGRCIFGCRRARDRAADHRRRGDGGRRAALFEHAVMALASELEETQARVDKLTAALEEEARRAGRRRPPRRRPRSGGEGGGGRRRRRRRRRAAESAARSRRRRAAAIENIARLEAEAEADGIT